MRDADHRRRRPFLLFAFGVKAALFPVFFWLPACYHTPSFTTSALFAALLTKVGVYALIRVFTLVYPVEGTPIQAVLLWAAVLSMVVGALGGARDGHGRGGCSASRSSPRSAT